MWRKFFKAAVIASAMILSTVHSAEAVKQTADEEVPVKEITEAFTKMNQTAFPIGVPNANYSRYFTGKTYLYPMENSGGLSVANVTFEPGAINFWHIHRKSCQVLVGLAGEGWYQIWGQPPKRMLPGVSVTIPEGVKHWHGATSSSWFQHLSIMQDGSTTEWLEPVDENFYKNLNR